MFKCTRMGPEQKFELKQKQRTQLKRSSCPGLSGGLRHAILHLASAFVQDKNISLTDDSPICLSPGEKMKWEVYPFLEK